MSNPDSTSWISTSVIPSRPGTIVSSNTNPHLPVSWRPATTSEASGSEASISAIVRLSDTMPTRPWPENESVTRYPVIRLPRSLSTLKSTQSTRRDGQLSGDDIESRTVHMIGLIHANFHVIEAEQCKDG